MSGSPLNIEQTLQDSNPARGFTDVLATFSPIDFRTAANPPALLTGATGPALNYASQLAEMTFQDDAHKALALFTMPENFRGGGAPLRALVYVSGVDSADVTLTMDFHAFDFAAGTPKSFTAVTKVVPSATIGRVEVDLTAMKTSGGKFLEPGDPVAMEITCIGSGIAVTKIMAVQLVGARHASLKNRADRAW